MSLARSLSCKFVPKVIYFVAPTIFEATSFAHGEAWALLKGLQRQSNGFHVLQSVESFFCTGRASCKLNASSFIVDITASNDQCKTILRNEAKHPDGAATCNPLEEASNCSSYLHSPSNNLFFRISVFQQIPGALLVKASLQHRDNPVPGSSIEIYSFCLFLSYIQPWMREVISLI